MQVKAIDIAEAAVNPPNQADRIALWAGIPY
jgi:hypothetical protein